MKIKKIILASALCFFSLTAVACNKKTTTKNSATKGDVTTNSNKTNNNSTTGSKTTANKTTKHEASEYNINYYKAKDSSDERKLVGIDEANFYINNAGSGDYYMTIDGSNVTIKQYLTFNNKTDIDKNYSISNIHLYNEMSSEEHNIYLLIQGPSGSTIKDDTIYNIKAGKTNRIYFKASFTDLKAYDSDNSEFARYYVKFDMKDNTNGDVFHVQFHIHEEELDYEKKDVKLTYGSSYELSDGLTVKYATTDHNELNDGSIVDLIEIENKSSKTDSILYKECYLSNHYCNPSVSLGPDYSTNIYEYNEIKENNKLIFETYYYDSNIETIDDLKEIKLHIVFYSKLNKACYDIEISY